MIYSNGAARGYQGYGSVGLGTASPVSGSECPAQQSGFWNWDTYCNCMYPADVAPVANGDCKHSVLPPWTIGASLLSAAGIKSVADAKAAYEKLKATGANPGTTAADPAAGANGDPRLVPTGQYREPQSGGIWWVEGGRRWHIDSMNTVNALNASGHPVNNIDVALLKAIPDTGIAYETRGNNTNIKDTAAAGIGAGGILIALGIGAALLGKR